jgi:hypothetical protein
MLRRETIIRKGKGEDNNTKGKRMVRNLNRPVRLAYQPPASSTFLSEQISHQQPANSTFLSEQTGTSHQPPEQAEYLIQTITWFRSQCWSV